MPISLDCSCGRTFRVGDEYAGRKVRCSGCRAVLTVPELEEQAAPDDHLVTAQPVEKEEGYSLRDEIEDDSAPPRIDTGRPRRRKVRRSDPALSKGWFGSINGGILGGILMMVIAIAWFFGGLAINRIFIYPPILFVIGIAAFIKGITDNR